MFVKSDWGYPESGFTDRCMSVSSRSRCYPYTIDVRPLHHRSSYLSSLFDDFWDRLWYRLILSTTPLYPTDILFQLGLLTSVGRCILASATSWPSHPSKFPYPTSQGPRTARPTPPHSLGDSLKWSIGPCTGRPTSEPSLRWDYIVRNAIRLQASPRLGGHQESFAA